MNQIDRRTFLKTASATAALGMLPPSIARALSIPANNATGTINDIEHVVILMQENRGFDHYFGTMKGVRGYGDRFPPLRPDGKPNWFESDGTKDITPFHLDPATVNALRVSSNPHDWMTAQDAWNQGRFGQWAKYKTFKSMGYYHREDIPFQFALAEAFTLCDAYHCAMTTCTDPNRIVFFSGSNYNPDVRAAGKNATDADAEYTNIRCSVGGTLNATTGVGYVYETGADAVAFTAWKTLPEILQDAGITWRIYQNPNDNWNGLLHGGLAFESFRSSRPGDPLFDNGMSNWTIAQLQSHVQDGTLPAVSWILPNKGESEHPGGPSSALEGAVFIESILEALTSNPDVWSKTAFFITYDENDGFFDHTAAPAVPSYNPDGTQAGNSTLDVTGEYFDTAGNPALDGANSSGDVMTLRPWGLGPRVPMFIVSPWSKGGFVNSQEFTHTSMGQFLEKRFGISVPQISPWHRAVVGDLTSAFDFVTPNDPALPALPDTSGYPAIITAQLGMPAVTEPAGPVALFQETGTKFSRALPYELHTSALVDYNTGKVTLLFSNTGTQGAVFHVYDKKHLDRIPRRYTVEAGKTLSDDFWDANATDFGLYDLMIIGPNGFNRGFKGSAASVSGGTKPEMRVCYDVDNEAVYLSARNDGTAPSTLVVTANAYRTDGPWTLNVAPGAEVEQHWALGDSGNWYDFTVTETATGLVRTFAGRIENGKSSVTDPAMAMGLGGNGSST